MSQTFVAPPKTRTILVVGKESVGKSQLISSLTGRSAGETNFRGSTVVVQRYRSGNTEYIDTPGILRSSDTETTRLALEALAANEVVLLVVQATSLDQDLSDMLPLVAGKRGAVVVTYWDKVQLGEAAQEAMERLAADDGLSFPMTATQALTAVYLAGVLLPCLVTAMTIGRETGWKSTAQLLARQAGFATLFALMLAWSGRWLL